MPFHLNASDFVLTLALALLGTLATSLPGRPVGWPRVALRALLADLAALLVVVGLTALPRLLE